MKIKILAWVVVLLAAAAALVFWLDRPAAPSSPDPRVGQPLLDGSIVERAVTLRLSDQGKTVVVAKEADRSWHDRSYFDLPADFSKLSSFIGDLTSAKIDRFVSESPRTIARLEFAGARVELLDAAGQPLWSADFGKTSEEGGRFVRFSGETKAYLAGSSPWIDTDAKGWADASLINLKPEDVARIELSFGPGRPLILSRAKTSLPWKADATPPGKVVNEDDVASLLATFDSLRFTDTTALSDPQALAAQRHLRLCVLTTFGGQTYWISVGRKPEEKKPKPAQAAPAVAASKPPAKPGAPAGAKPTAPKPPAPEYETVPAGPVFVFVRSSDPKAPVNATMAKRACETDEYVLTSLPQTQADLFEPIPPATPAKSR